MICDKCGAEIMDNSKFCSMCGAVIEEKSNEVVEVQNNEQNTQEVVVSASIEEIKDNNSISANKELSWKALVGMIVALSGILISTMICGIVGLIFSCLGLVDVSRKNKSGKGMAITGFVVSIIDIFLGFISLMISCFIWLI